MKKNAPGIARSPTKVRAIGSEKIGSTSRSRAPSTARTRPGSSQIITSPVHPQARKTKRRTSPETQARARGPQLRPWTHMRRA